MGGGEAKEGRDWTKGGVSSPGRTHMTHLRLVVNVDRHRSADRDRSAGPGSCPDRGTRSRTRVWVGAWRVEGTSCKDGCGWAAAGRRSPKWVGGRGQLSSGTLRAVREAGVLRLDRAGLWEAGGWEVWSEEGSVHAGTQGGEEHVRGGGSAHLQASSLGTSAPHWTGRGVAVGSKVRGLQRPG